MLSRWKCAVRQRWRAVASVVVALAFLLLVLSACWVPVFDSATAPRPAAGQDAAAVRRLLLDGVRDERGSWSCAVVNSSSGADCSLTPSLLATTDAARRSVYSRTGLDCLAMFHGDAGQIDAARSVQYTCSRPSVDGMA